MNIIPTQKDPYYTFDIAINGVVNTLEFMYNTRAGHWTVSVYRSKQPVVMGVPLLTIDGLLDQYVVGLDGIIPLDVSLGEDPNIDNIENVVMFMLTGEEINASTK